MADNVHPGEAPTAGAHGIPPYPFENSITVNPVLPNTSNSGGVSLREDPSLDSPRTKAHRRSPTILKDSNHHLDSHGEPTRRPAAGKVRRDSADVIPNRSPPDAPEPNHVRSRSSATSSSTMSNLTRLNTATHESGSSSGSASTIRSPSPRRRDDDMKVRNRPKRPPTKKTNAMSFLNQDSPELSSERIRQSIETASNRSVSSASSGFRDDASDLFGDHETDMSTSPERSINGDGVEIPHLSTTTKLDTKNAPRAYGSPEMAHAWGSQPHMSPEVATPRAPNQGPFMYPPRPEIPSSTGYGLLASHLSTSALRPIYRRFQALNHRLLLHFQHEICELEWQLDQLDNTDAENRWRHDFMPPGPGMAGQPWGNELHRHRIEIMGQAGFKLDKYYSLISSLQQAQSFPAPSPDDIRVYRDFLATHARNPDAETRFLDAHHDLICLSEDDEEDDETIATPLPHMQSDFKPPRQLDANHVIPPMPRPAEYSEYTTTTGAPTPNPSAPTPPLLSLSLAMAAAVILPVLAFAVIPGFLGRMAVVFVVLAGGLGVLFQDNAGGLGLGLERTQDVCVCAGCYGAVMAILASTIA